MRKFAAFFLMLGLLLASAVPASGDSRNVRVRNITMDNGLPTNAVRNIVQDKFGFMWFGTDNGLCRYNGYGVQTFFNPYQKYDQYVSTLRTTDDGILVGTSKGVYRFIFRTETFERLNGQITSQANAITQDVDGNIWVATQGQGVFRCSIRSQQVKNYPMPQWRGNVATVLVDGNNQVWILSLQSNSKPWRLNKGSDGFEPVKVESDAINLSGRSMIQAADGSLLIGTWSDGLVQLYSDGTTRQLLNPVLANMGHHIHALFRHSDQEIYIGCDEGLILYDLQQHSWKLLSEETVHPVKNIAERFVYSITKDGEGGTWLGTFYGGVSYISPIQQRFHTYMNGSGTADLHGNVVGRFAEDRQRRIWIATDDGGLNCYDAPNDRFVDYPGRSVLSKYNVHGLLVDGDYLWVGTYGNGVIRLNLASGGMQTFQLDSYPHNSSCYCLFRDSKRRLWATSMEGVNVFDEQAQTFKPVKALGATTVSMAEDTQGNVWLGTQGDGLWCYQAKGSAQGAWKHYMPVEKDATSLFSNSVNCVSCSSSGNLYVVTDMGLCQYMPAADNFKRMVIDASTKDYSCIVVHQDEMWLSSSKGILRYIPGEAVQMFNRYDGLTCDQFLANSGFMASDGRIYFGTVRGFNTFYPHQVKVNQVAPSVFITSLELFNEPVSVGSTLLPEALSQIKQLDLHYGDDMFSISFAALSYISPEKNQYAYMLEGFDKDWIYAGSEHKATYTNIPAGTYTFRVKATNNDGVWSQQEATLKIEMHPPFWWSLPAKMLYLLLIGYLIYLYTQMKLRKEKRHHQLELQLLNDKKEQEIRDARLQFFTMIAHEIRTPVSLIIGPLETLKDEWTKLSRQIQGNASMTQTLDVIDRNAQRLLNLVNQLLDFNKVQQQGLQVRFKLNNIAQLMHAVAERFEPTLKKKGARLVVDYPAEDFAAIIDNEAITKVVSNLMTNASKYTKDYVRLSCRLVDKEHFRIEVEDNGIGIHKDEMNKIFTAFYQARDNKPGTGIGLNIVKNLVEAHHGKVEVKSTVGKGSTFMVTLPVQQQDVEVGEDEALVVDKQVTDMGEAKTVEPEGIAAATEEKMPPVMLIVEDDEDMRNFIAANFRDSYQVLTAENGVEGLQQLHRHHVTLIVSDWMMPEMDGSEFCRRVRRNPDTSHIPFILLTAKTDNDSKTEGMNCGADAYIEKPFSLKYLEACIRNMIEMRQLLQSKFSHTPLEPITRIAQTEVDNELLTKMTQLIEDNIDSPDLNVAFLADKLGISRSTLFAKIKALADATPNEMIQIVKLKKSAQLLKEGKYRVNEVCYMVGFSSPSYFSKCFSRQFGVKPADFCEANNSKGIKEQKQQ